jgi:hypothetical protein
MYEFIDLSYIAHINSLQHWDEGKGVNFLNTLSMCDYSDNFTPRKTKLYTLIRIHICIMMSEKYFAVFMKVGLWIRMEIRSQRLISLVHSRIINMNRGIL